MVAHTTSVALQHIQEKGEDVIEEWSNIVSIKLPQRADPKALSPTGLQLFSPEVQC